MTSVYCFVKAAMLIRLFSITCALFTLLCNITILHPLNELQMLYHMLQVKVDAKTQALLDEYRTKKKEKEKGVSVEQTKTNKDVEKSIVKDDTEDIKGDNKSIETDKDIEGSVDKNTEDAKSKCENGEHVDKEDGEESPVERKEEELDENSKREDRVAQAGLEAIMKEYVFELSKEIPSPKSSKLVLIMHQTF